MGSASYLDTTVLVDVSAERQPGCNSALSHTQKNPPVYVADYAYKELLIGRVGLLCDVHNKLIACDNVLEIALAFLSQGAFARTPRSKAIEILQPLKEMFDAKANVSVADAKREIVEDLMLQATKLWRRAARFPNATPVQPLPCRNSGSLDLDANGILKGPNGTFNCSKNTSCGAATYIYADQVVLKKMIAALDESNLPEELRTKGEIKSRRKALKHLLQRGPTSINRKQCRQLGDAYFAAMCPPDAHILTTNSIDFLPLCQALSKDVKTP